MRRRLSPEDNKYSRGTVVIAAGSAKYHGAALLATGGARRGNAGYVKYLSGNSRLRELVVSNYPDVVPIKSIANQRCDAFVIGPGTPTITTIPRYIPVVLDSSAISLLQRPAMRKRIHLPVITPHEGELRNLGYQFESHLSANERISVSREIATHLGAIVVLKGHRTLIVSPDGRFKIDQIGGPELATAGSGDILAGLIGSMLVAAKSGSDPFDLVCGAVELHSRAGRYAAREFTAVSAVEILSSLAHV